jgi:hypothetical protein
VYFIYRYKSNNNLNYKKGVYGKKLSIDTYNLKLKINFIIANIGIGKAKVYFSYSLL